MVASDAALRLTEKLKSRVKRIVTTIIKEKLDVLSLEFMILFLPSSTVKIFDILSLNNQQLFKNWAKGDDKFSLLQSSKTGITLRFDEMKGSRNHFYYLLIKLYITQSDNASILNLWQVTNERWPKEKIELLGSD
jgi:hypothetical protein